VPQTVSNNTKVMRNKKRKINLGVLIGLSSSIWILTALFKKTGNKTERSVKKFRKSWT